MGKKENHRNKASHSSRMDKVDRSTFWKYGKSSGHPDPEVAKARREKRLNEKARDGEN
jgi:hypothetical protein